MKKSVQHKDCGDDEKVVATLKRSVSAVFLSNRFDALCAETVIAVVAFGGLGEPVRAEFEGGFAIVFNTDCKDAAVLCGRNADETLVFVHGQKIFDCIVDCVAEERVDFLRGHKRQCLAVQHDCQLYLLRVAEKGFLRKQSVECIVARLDLCVEDGDCFLRLFNELAVKVLSFEHGAELVLHIVALEIDELHVLLLQF